MGYTHYFPQEKAVPPEQWQALKEDVLRLFPLLPAHSDSAGGHYAHEPLDICDGFGDCVAGHGEELFNVDHCGEALSFNGDGSKGLDHETFSLTQYHLGDFNFCKTARKPYDWLAVAVLLLAHKHCPGCWRIGSDGDAKDWQPVIDWLNAHGFGPVELPFNDG